MSPEDNTIIIDFLEPKLLLLKDVMHKHVMAYSVEEELDGVCEYDG